MYYEYSLLHMLLQMLREGFMDALQGLCTVTEQSAIYQVGAAVANFSTKQVRAALITALVVIGW